MHVILSPHHDDAILSLPYILLNKRNNKIFKILIIFSEETDFIKSVCNKLHTDLGFQPITLGILEAKRRGIKLREILNSNRAPKTTNCLLLEEVVQSIQISLYKAHIIPFSFIVPCTRIHIDHSIVKNAAERLSPIMNVPISFYNDQPYSQLQNKPEYNINIGLISFDIHSIQTLLNNLRVFIGNRDIDRLINYYTYLKNKQMG